MATKIPTRRITMMAPFEDVSAKFALQKNRCSSRATKSTTAPPPSIKYFGARVLQRSTRNAGGYTVNSFYFRKNPRTSALSSREITIKEYFTIAAQSTKNTLMNLAAVTQIQVDYKNKQQGSAIPTPIRQGVNSADYATMRGWVFAVRVAQLNDGQPVTATTDSWTFPLT